MTHATKPSDNWAPQYFLASVGAGGIAVAFFIWLMMWVPHPGQTVPIFEDIAAHFGAAGLLSQAMMAVAMAGIAVFAFFNLKLLVWNMGRFGQFKKSAAMDKLRSTNAEVQLLAMPLALAMTINVLFILGMVFVPKLWTVVEYLFPVAMAAFLTVGALALGLLGRFYGRVFGKGGLDWAANNNFGQVLPAFALGMVAVGLSAAAALSGNAVTVGISITLASIFFVIALIIALIAVVAAFVSMAQHGVGAEMAPTLTIIVPLTTVLGIFALRVNHGLGTQFGAHMENGEYLYLLALFVGVQIAFGLFSLAVLRAQGYFGRFVTGPEASPGSYALVCPGVGFSVMMQFLINKGLVAAGVVTKFSAAYWALSAISVAALLGTVVLVLMLNAKHFGAARLAAVPAE